VVAWRTQLVSAAKYADAFIERGCKALLLITGLALLALLSLGVVLRYFFQSGFSFAPDLSELLFAIFVMAGIVQAARLGVHVATQLLLNALSPRYRIALAVLIHALTATVYFLLGYYAFENAIIAHDQVSPVLRIPWSVGYGCLSAGLTLVAACSAIAILRHTAGGEPVHVDLADPGAAVT
jgi:TRAP-type transport system small permease protein